MIKEYDIALVVGTRPNFVKAAPLLKKLEENNKSVLFIHTGQHFDKSMSNNIFEDLKIRNPDLNLDAPKDTQSKQFQYIVEELEKVFNNFKIDKVGVFGDVTSTLAASIAAKNANKYLFHVESGLRSNNLHIGYAPCTAIRVNFVGELGWELHHPLEYQNHIFDKLMEHGKDLGITI